MCCEPIYLHWPSVLSYVLKVLQSNGFSDLHCGIALLKDLIHFLSLSGLGGGWLLNDWSRM